MKKPSMPPRPGHRSGRRRSPPEGVIQPGSIPYDINCDNPLLSQQQASALCGTAAGTATNVRTDVRYRFTDAQSTL